MGTCRRGQARLGRQVRRVRGTQRDSSRLSVNSASTVVWSRRGCGAVQHDAPAVVAFVAIATDDTLDGLDRSVVALGSGVRHPQLKEVEDLRPPGFDGLRKPGQLRHVPLGGAGVELVELGADLIRPDAAVDLSLIHISEPTRLGMISYA